MPLSCAILRDLPSGKLPQLQPEDAWESLGRKMDCQQLDLVDWVSKTKIEDSVRADG